MSLETRGLRPDPKTRGVIAAYLYREMDHSWRLTYRDQISNQAIHGVPVGPSNPAKLRGIEWFGDRLGFIDAR